MKEMRNVYRFVVGKIEGKRQLGRPRHGWDRVKIDLNKLGERVWTLLIWLRLETSGFFL
jgi:hypothetical protein